MHLLSYYLVRTLFSISMAMLALALLIACAELAFGLEAFEPAVSFAFATLVVGGLAGLFLSVVLAHRVHCPACGEKAMVFPDRDSDEPGNFHQPWRGSCGRCGSTLG